MFWFHELKKAPLSMKIIIISGQLSSFVNVFLLSLVSDKGYECLGNLQVSDVMYQCFFRIAVSLGF